jgi:hypothetical protein
VEVVGYGEGLISDLQTQGLETPFDPVHGVRRDVALAEGVSHVILKLH